MKQFTYTVKDKNGMHARPAGKLATYAKQFSSNITVRCKEKEADGKRLLSLMSLGAVCGAELEFFISGEDEEEASVSLERYCEENWSSGD